MTPWRLPNYYPIMADDCLTTVQLLLFNYVLDICLMTFFQKLILFIIIVKAFALNCKNRHTTLTTKIWGLWGCVQMRTAEKKACLNVSTTSITAMGCRQCLPLSVVQLKGKHCRKPHCRNGVVDTFGHATKFGMRPVFGRYLQVYVEILLVFATHSTISLKHKSNFGPKKYICH